MRNHPNPSQATSSKESSNLCISAAEVCSALCTIPRKHAKRKRATEADLSVAGTRRDKRYQPFSCSFIYLALPNPQSPLPITLQSPVGLMTHF